MQGAMDKLNEALQGDFAAVRAIKAYVRDGVSERLKKLIAVCTDC